MTPEDLVEHEAIKRLKYRYARTLDQKDWEGVAGCFTEDATASYGGGKQRLEGREAIMRFLKSALETKTMISSHTVGQPEIELTGPDTATATWALQDLVIDTSRDFTVRGASFYSDAYAKVDGEWKLTHTSYKRVFEELSRRPADIKLTASWHGTGGRSELIP
ncbi:MAG: nuclear transport factor 2 family protein [Actinobacteria bacterium]|nr:nuclear transport factor 2 family protein [Actinomycetota bacterium]